MTFQVKGIQVSLLVHATAILLVWGLNGSLVQTGTHTIELNFSINRSPISSAKEIKRETPPDRSLAENHPPVQEREASLDGKIVASIADAPPAAPRNAESVLSNNDGRSADVEFGAITGPFYHRQVMPWYPTIARKLGKEGLVLLRLTIDEKGKLLNVEVLEDPGYGFAEAALKAVKQSSYIPAHRAGNPVLTKALLPIKFVLRKFE